MAVDSVPHSTCYARIYGGDSNGCRDKWSHDVYQVVRISNVETSVEGFSGGAIESIASLNQDLNRSFLRCYGTYLCCSIHELQVVLCQNMSCSRCCACTEDMCLIHHTQFCEREHEGQETSPTKRSQSCTLWCESITAVTANFQCTLHNHIVKDFHFVDCRCAVICTSDLKLSCQCKWTFRS